MRFVLGGLSFYTPGMWRGIPLADKSLAWFGLAIVLGDLRVPVSRVHVGTLRGRRICIPRLATSWRRMDPLGLSSFSLFAEGGPPPNN
jgi:hypothetical protein